MTKIGPGLLTLSGSNNYSGGTIVANGDLLISSTSGIPATGKIDLTSGALLSAGAYTTVTQWLGSNKISTTSSGAIALTANSAEAINMASYPILSLGAALNTTATYTGTLTPAGNTYYLGGGGGTLGPAQ